ncbi:MalY/PatB family protein [Bacillus sp. FJAT-50079]|uniref:MalY/PatB family protein n=1 Tax=Bacillus sp. FJAT-50079 TaxID=2833577 RepID=UPI001BCA3B2F|nr:MalY/PatB family protein [Bacillus sp. FJAT-50079]MBS4208560.1 pyridoxal phosphate-dependent aminotransferase [Bacillus sp. FJAT-50079]
MINFDELIDRKQTKSVKWDGMKAVFGDDELLPMWVADMDFRPPEAVLAAMKTRIDHGVFGYSLAGQSTANAIMSWTKKRHHWEIKQGWIVYSSGVVPALATAVQAFTEPGDKVLVQSPVYTPFFSVIENNLRTVVNSPLILNNGRYEIDFLDFEEKLKSGVKLFLLCNPHNPGGRVWTKEELERIAQLCKQYGVIVASDEIHADLVAQPYKHTPFSSLGETYEKMSLTFMAPSKTFNLAGLQAAFMVIPNQEMRTKVKAIQAKDGHFALNTFGIIAMETAYLHGEEWLDQLLDYIRTNIELVKNFVQEHLPQLTVIAPEGSYLVWIDCRKTGFNEEELRKRLLEKGKLAVNFGEAYGSGGEGFIRLNIAFHRNLVQEGLQRLKRAFN